MSITVRQNPDKEVPTEVLADAIIAISEGVKKLRAGRLTDKALYLLIQHAAPSVGNKPLSQKEIKAVLEGAESLARTFIKKKSA